MVLLDVTNRLEMSCFAEG